ncbi:MAG: hypothetical protein HYZ37_17285 [Candidatus Solibacter usitatus]|nr:hypothetical protein [Candidatus Solibacter usitatus]
MKSQDIWIQYGKQLLSIRDNDLPGRPLLRILTAFLFAWMAAAAPKDASWAPFAYLEGEWTGEGSGQPGEGSGGCTFSFDLNDTVLIRKNWANYPATKDRPAFAHADHMTIYRGEGRFHAVYFDSEGHTILYAVSVSGAGKEIQFVSAAGAPGPRYRLTYQRQGEKELTLKFEMAPTGKPETFASYITARLRRK